MDTTKNKLIKFHKLSLGTAQFGMHYGINQDGKVSYSEVGKILNYASNYNIKFLDTAILYGNSEMVIGNFGASKFQVITKLPPLGNGNHVKKKIAEMLEESNRKLGDHEIEGVLLHNPNDINYNNTIDALEKLKDEKKIKKFGISIYSPTDLETCKFLHRIDIIQTPYSIVDQRICNSGWLRRLKQMKIEVQARSIFLQGLLLRKYNSLPAMFSSESELWKRWHDWLAKSNVSALSCCLEFVFNNNLFDRYVVGINSKQHLVEITSALSQHKITSFPDIRSENETFINPSKWNHP